MSVADWFEEMRELGKVTKLPEKLSEGVVEKVTIFQSNTVPSGEVSEVSVLHLTKGSAIKRHRHIIDSETYILIGFDTVLKCNVGEEHELENFVDGELFVFAVKKLA